MAEHPSAAPQGSVPTWGQLTGWRGRGEFTCGEQRSEEGKERGRWPNPSFSKFPPILV